MISRLLQNYDHDRQLTMVWAILIVLTFSSVLLADRGAAGALVVCVVCLSFAIKGSLVTEQLMGLYRAAKSVRRLMLGYFIVLPLLIAVAVIYPDWIARITTL